MSEQKGAKTPRGRGLERKAALECETSPPGSESGYDGAVQNKPALAAMNVGAIGRGDEGERIPLPIKV